MNEQEKHALDCLVEAWNALIACGLADAETAFHVHALQHAVMAAPTRRLHPSVFRQLDGRAP